MTSPVREGDILAGKYRVERVLGAGGMGVVVAAKHEQLDQRVALKFLLPEGVGNEENLARFLREARTVVRLRSEHVAKVLDVGTLDTGSPYIVMEYLEGCDLEAVLTEQGTLSLELAAEYMLQASQALAEAHAGGLVHRDLKPANLFLTRRTDGSDCVKVLDFGISKSSRPNDMNLTKTTALMGTPYYMSPEQLRSPKLVDARSDIWGLGMILYELLSGRVPFACETLPELCVAILHEPVRSIRDVRPDLPPEIDQVLARALAKDPAERYQTLAEFANALAHFAPGGEGAADRVSRILRPSLRPPASRVSREARRAAIEQGRTQLSPDTRRDPVTAASGSIDDVTISEATDRATSVSSPLERTRLEPDDSSSAIPGLPARRGWLLPAGVFLGATLLCGGAALTWRQTRPAGARVAEPVPATSAVVAAELATPAATAVEDASVPLAATPAPKPSQLPATAGDVRARSPAPKRPPTLRPQPVAPATPTKRKRDFGGRE